MTLRSRTIVSLLLLLLVSLATFVRAQQVDRAQEKAKADAAIEQGEKLFREGTGESVVQGLRKYQDALVIFRRLKDYQSEALTLQRLAEISAAFGQKEQELHFYEEATRLHRQTGDHASELNLLSRVAKLQVALGQNQKALDAYIRQLELYRQLNDRQNEAATMELIAHGYYAMKNWQKAQVSYSQSLEMFRALGDPRTHKREAAMLTRLGFVYLELNEYEKALKCFRKALPIHQALSDLQAQGDALRGIATALDLLGDPQQALKSAEEALELYRLRNYRPGVTRLLNQIGLLYDALGDLRKALDFYNQVLAINVEIGNKRDEAVVRTNIGLVYGSLGIPEKALEFHNAALAISQSLRDRETEADILNNIANSQASLGNFQQAMESFQKALPLHRETRNRAGEANSLGGIGSMYEVMGQTEKAIDYFNQSLALQRAIKRPRGEASSLYNFGALYLSLGDYQKALEFFNESIRIRRSVGDRFGEAVALNGIGAVYRSSGEPDKALEFYREALAVHRAVGNRAGEGTTLGNIGLVHAELEEREKAREFYAQALELIRGGGDLFNETIMLAHLGRLHLQNDNQKALAYFQEALTLNSQVRTSDNEGDILHGLMFVWYLLGKPELSILYGKQAVNSYQETRSHLRKVDPGLQRSFLSSREGTYRQLVEFLIASGRLPEAQQVLRMLKQQEYFDFVRGDPETTELTETCALTPAESRATQRYDAAAGRVLKAATEFNAGKSSGSPANDPSYQKQKSEFDLAIQNLQQLFKAFAEEFSQTELRADPKSVNQELQSEANSWQPGTVSLYTIVGPDNYQVILTTPNRQIARQASPKVRAADLNRLVLEFRSALQDQNADPIPLGQQLYQILIGPIAKDLDAAGAKTLVWSLDGTLRYLPIAALHDGKQYLVERYQTMVVALAGSREPAGTSVVEWRALGLGVSKTKKTNDGVSFRPLPFVPGELRSIIREGNQTGGIVSGKVLLDEAFTLKTMEQSLLAGRYPLVHIASHFLFKPGNDIDSFLLLGDGDKLTLEKIRNSTRPLFTGVHLLTLSACDTATSSTANGRELEGFAVLAQRQGAKAVLATLWPAEDESTPDLMRSFYKNRVASQTISNAEVLRQAQLMLLRGNDSGSLRRDMRDDKSTSAEKGNASSTGVKPKFAHPYFWAPFILIGDWR